MHGLDQPSGTGPLWGGQWADAAMADSYDARPGYPAETFDVLANLIHRDGGPICDIGAGTGRLTFELARRFGAVDAVEPSEQMVLRARQVSDDPLVRWIVAPFEVAPVGGTYGLVVGAESLHWLDWSVAFPRIARILREGAFLVSLGQRWQAVHARHEAVPWNRDVVALIAEYSTNQEFVPYDFIEEITRRGFFELLGHHVTSPVIHEESPDHFIERLHSANGFSRDRMGARGEELDAQLRSVLSRHTTGGVLRSHMTVDIQWGYPRP